MCLVTEGRDARRKFVLFNEEELTTDKRCKKKLLGDVDLIVFFSHGINNRRVNISRERASLMSDTLGPQAGHELFFTDASELAVTPTNRRDY
jgi:hypothetical protein